MFRDWRHVAMVILAVAFLANLAWEFLCVVDMGFQDVPAFWASIGAAYRPVVFASFVILLGAIYVPRVVGYAGTVLALWAVPFSLDAIAAWATNPIDLPMDVPSLLVKGILLIAFSIVCALDAAASIRDRFRPRTPQPPPPVPGERPTAPAAPAGGRRGPGGGGRAGGSPGAEASHQAGDPGRGAGGAPGTAAQGEEDGAVAEEAAQGDAGERGGP